MAHMQWSKLLRVYFGASQTELQGLLNLGFFGDQLLQANLSTSALDLSPRRSIVAFQPSSFGIDHVLHDLTTIKYPSSSPNRRGLLVSPRAAQHGDAALAAGSPYEPECSVRVCIPPHYPLIKQF